jgi:hypothetical protein
MEGWTTSFKRTIEGTGVNEIIEEGATGILEIL